MSLSLLWGHCHSRSVLQLFEVGRLASRTVEPRHRPQCLKGAAQRDEPEHTSQRMPSLPGSCRPGQPPWAGRRAGGEQAGACTGLGASPAARGDGETVELWARECRSPGRWSTDLCTVCAQLVGGVLRNSPQERSLWTRRRSAWGSWS